MRFSGCSEAAFQAVTKVYMLTSFLFSNHRVEPTNIERHYEGTRRTDSHSWSIHVVRSIRCVCACGLCARANNFRILRHLSEYIETEMAKVTNRGKRRSAGTEYTANNLVAMSNQ